MWKQLALNEAAIAVMAANFPDMNDIEFVCIYQYVTTNYFTACFFIPFFHIFYTLYVQIEFITLMLEFIYISNSCFLVFLSSK